MSESVSYNPFTGRLDLIGTSSSTTLNVPVMTTSNRLSSSPSVGSLVYDSDLEALFIYSGNAWVQVGN